jgi:hypothetical protein
VLSRNRTNQSPTAERNRKKELRTLADRISTYGRKIHQRYPTGDVVVNECDLAEELRKCPDAVATALTLLLDEQKVQTAPLNGYWKINVWLQSTVRHNSGIFFRPSR